MQRLILLRHGKTEQHAPSGQDFDRVLTARGRRDSLLVAQALTREGFSPDLALVSPAARALQTWQAVAPLFPKAKVVTDKPLYEAEPEAILAAARTQGADMRTVMVVAHNPGLHQLALTLVQSCPDAPERAQLFAGFPTGAAAAFDLDAGRLVLLTPKALGGGA
jgi:phosphohistidine phosphatase